ncbi:MAG: ABC transporter permease subunit [Deltaproteobacteria bacterium]|nr:ABC transporter permease subunit [Deltaproteobacteria bacterium]
MSRDRLIAGPQGAMTVSPSAGGHLPPRGARGSGRSRTGGSGAPLRRLAALAVAGGVIVAVWSILAHLSPPSLFPSLPMVLRALRGTFLTGEVLSATLSTVRTVAIGSFFALFTGLLFGFLLRWRESTFLAIVHFFQTIPPVIWSLFAVIWFGVTLVAALFVIQVVCFPIIAMNTWEGLKNLDPEYLQVARTVNAKRGMVLRHVVVPSLTPYLLGGVRIMVGFAWKISVLAELITGLEGVGLSLYRAWQNVETPDLLAWTLWLVCLMWATEYGLIRPLDRALMRWRRA